MRVSRFVIGAYDCRENIGAEDRPPTMVNVEVEDTRATFTLIRTKYTRQKPPPLTTAHSGRTRRTIRRQGGDHPAHDVVLVFSPSLCYTLERCARGG